MKPNVITAIVTKGDRIPWDGIVVDGFAMVDESAIVGVSTPAMLEAVEGRNNVYAGTLVLAGWLKIESSLNARMYVPTEEDKQRKREMNNDAPPLPLPAKNNKQLIISVVLALAAVVAIIAFTA